MCDSPPPSWESDRELLEEEAVLYLSTEHKEYVNSVALLSASLSQGSSSGMGERLPAAVLDTSVIAKDKEFLNNLHVYTY